MRKKKRDEETEEIPTKKWTDELLDELIKEIEAHGGLGSKEKLFTFLRDKGALSKRSTVDEWIVLYDGIGQSKYGELLEGIGLAQKRRAYLAPQNEGLEKLALGMREPVDINPNDVPL